MSESKPPQDIRRNARRVRTVIQQNRFIKKFSQENIFGKYEEKPLLVERFLDIAEWVITRAIVNHRNPEIYLVKFREKMQELKERYPELSDSRLAVAITHYDEPEDYIASLAEAA